MDHMALGNRWSTDELMAACALYFTLPFGQMHARNPQIRKLAVLLGRTPSSVAMKLVNFASLDPEHQRRGVRGLSGASKADREVWTEFRERWRNAPEEIGGSVEKTALVFGEEADAAMQSTEVERTIQARRVQWFFRKVVLAAYKSTCCITGNPVPGLLVASHILPWSKFALYRTEPTNGLCLSATFDHAFDRGLISFNEDRRLLISPQLQRFLPNPTLEVEFFGRAGQVLRAPERFAPDPEFLRIHRSTIFAAE